LRFSETTINFLDCLELTLLAARLVNWSDVFAVSICSEWLCKLINLGTADRRKNVYSKHRKLFRKDALEEHYGDRTREKTELANEWTGDSTADTWTNRESSCGFRLTRSSWLATTSEVSTSERHEVFVVWRGGNPERKYISRG